VRVARRGGRYVWAGGRELLHIWTSRGRNRFVVVAASSMLQAETALGKLSGAFALLLTACGTCALCGVAHRD
jgi:hypothetical protein